MKKYDQLAKELHTQIADGQFKANMKLPSVRQLCERHGFSMSTVVRALEVLQEDGVVESRERSGFYITATPINIPPTPEASYILEQPTQANKQKLVLGLMESFYNPKLFNMGAAIPSKHFLPVKELDKAARQAMRSSLYERDKYQSMPGNRLLREQISLYMHNLNCDVDPEYVVITSGCQEATMLALLSCMIAGETVAVETPTYPGFLQTCELLNLDVIEIPTNHDKGISVGALKLAIQQWNINSVLLSSNYSNPTSARMSTEKKKELIALCSKNSIKIIEDDVYGDVSHDPYYRPRPLKSFDKNDTVIYCNSFSKTISPGLRIGWMVNKELQTSLEYNKYVSGLSSVTISQHMIAEYLKRGKHERYLQSARRNYALHANRMLEKVHDLMPVGTRITNPKGGFMLWMALPEQIDTLELLDKTVAKGISFNPGILFSASNKHSNCLRLNCALKWNDQVKESLKIVFEEAHKMV